MVEIGRAEDVADIVEIVLALGTVNDDQTPLGVFSVASAFTLASVSSALSCGVSVSRATLRFL